MWEPSVKKWLLHDVRGRWMQYGVKGKGNRNVQAMGGQRGVTKSKPKQNLLPILAVWPSQVWEVCESLDVSTTESNQPSKQTYRWATARGSCDLSCPVPSAHCRALEEPAHSPVGPGAGTPQPPHSAFGEAWIRNLKHLRLLHFIQQNKNKTHPSSFSKCSVPFKI